MSAGVLLLVLIGLELGFERLLKTGGSLEQLVRWGRVGRREKNVGLHIRHRPGSNHQVRLTIIRSSPSLQDGQHPSCNRPRTLTAATGRCMSEPFVSVIGAAEVPAGPVQRQIRLHEIELNSIKSNQTNSI